jgi:hypothetical protein
MTFTKGIKASVAQTVIEIRLLLIGYLLGAAVHLCPDNEEGDMILKAIARIYIEQAKIFIRDART